MIPSTLALLNVMQTLGHCCIGYHRKCKQHANRHAHDLALKYFLDHATFSSMACDNLCNWWTSFGRQSPSCPEVRGEMRGWHWREEKAANFVILRKEVIKHRASTYSSTMLLYGTSCVSWLNSETTIAITWYLFKITKKLFSFLGFWSWGKRLHKILKFKGNSFSSF